LPPPHAQKIVNRAWHRICDYRLWSWLVGTGYITSPAAITTGLISVVNGSPLVTPNAAAVTALSAVALANPPLAAIGNQIGTGRQIRVANSTISTAGPLYSIIAYDSGIPQLTLDRPYAESTAANQGFMVYKAYYQPPPADGNPIDFLRYFTITNPSRGYTIRGRKLYYTQAQLNGIDPQRGGTGDAYILANYLDDAQSGLISGNPIHEWYPHPVNLATYSCIFQKRGLDLSDTRDIPSTCPEDLLTELCYVLGCKWAMQQVGTFPELGNVNWVAAMKSHQDDFKERLIQAIKTDDEISPLKAFQQGGTFDYPLGGQFLQNHDVSSLVGGLG
jgi:hypothetical protein